MRWIHHQCIIVVGYRANQLGTNVRNLSAIMKATAYASVVTGDTDKYLCHLPLLFICA